MDKDVYVEDEIHHGKSIEAKENRLVDFHCHPQMCPDCSDVTDDRILFANSYSLECFCKIKELAELHPHSIIPSYGIHPWAVQDLEIDELKKIIEEVEELLKSDPCACIGEVGLDYLKTRDIAERGKQREVLKEFINLANTYKRPISIHVVPSKGEVWNDLITCLSSFDKTIPIILHLYGGRQGMITTGRLSGYNIFPSVRVTGEEDKGVSPRVISILSLPRCLIESDCDGDRGKTLRWSKGVIEEGYKKKRECTKEISKDMDWMEEMGEYSNSLLGKICPIWMKREKIME